MKRINTYIIEKLKINKDSKTNPLYNEATIKLLYLCEIFTGTRNNAIKWIEENQDNIYYITINNWVMNNNIIDEHDYIAISDTNKLWNCVNMVNIIQSFKDDKEKYEKLCSELIVDGKGKEVLGPSFKDPKIYYKDNVLIYHDYREKYGNIDRIFIKK